MSKISASKARENFSDTLNRVAYAGERVVIHRRGKAVAALVSPADLALLEKLEDRQDVAPARKALAEPGRIPYAEYRRRRLGGPRPEKS